MFTQSVSIGAEDAKNVSGSCTIRKYVCVFRYCLYVFMKLIGKSNLYPCFRKYSRRPNLHKIYYMVDGSSQLVHLCDRLMV